MIIFTSSGLDLYKKLQIIAFKPTLLPVPVAPAIKRCGILSSSAVTGSPTIFLPRQIVSFDFVFSKTLEPTISLNLTSSFVSLATSMPITAFPGIGATILMLAARRASARSSVRLTILLIFIPGAGLYSNVVTTGPGNTAATFPLTPKSSSFFSSTFDRIFKFSLSAD